MTKALKELWGQLLSTKRLGTNKKDSIDRDSFEIDQDLITFSQPFRRLKDKTQLYPMAENDHVRTRLSHSLEVASVGQTLGSIIGSKIIERHQLDQSKYHRERFGSIVKAASLVDDIGHPPLGHMGEEAIREWFRSARGKELIDGLGSSVQKDLKWFEGNAQGFRIITQIENNKNQGGLRLTCATLAVLMKYPWGVDHPYAEKFGRKHKFGFFEPEKEYAKQVAETVGIRAVGSYGWVRHPLAYLSEAADDICYMLSDLEDGIDAGDFGVDEFCDLVIPFLRKQKTPVKWKTKYKTLEHTNQRISFLRSNCMRVLVDEVAEVFLANEAAIVEGKYYRKSEDDKFYRPLLDEIEDTKVNKFVKKLKKIPSDRLYDGPRKLYIETAYYRVTHGLLDAFTAAVLDESGLNKKHEHLKQLMGRDLPMDMANAEQKIRAVVDFISGMTDKFALGMYRQLEGISVGGLPTSVATA
jgi:dGTPase